MQFQRPRKKVELGLVKLKEEQCCWNKERANCRFSLSFWMREPCSHLRLFIYCYVLCVCSKKVHIVKHNCKRPHKFARAKNSRSISSNSAKMSVGRTFAKYILTGRWRSFLLSLSSSSNTRAKPPRPSIVRYLFQGWLLISRLAVQTKDTTLTLRIRVKTNRLRQTWYEEEKWWKLVVVHMHSFICACFSPATIDRAIDSQYVFPASWLSSLRWSSTFLQRGKYFVAAL